MGKARALLSDDELAQVREADRVRAQRKRERDRADAGKFTLPRPLLREILIDHGEIGEWDEGDDEKLTAALVRFLGRHLS